MNEIIKSHSTDSRLASELYQETVERLNKKFGHSNEELQTRIQILKELDQFDLGSFLIANKGLNGYWTEYVIKKGLSGHKNEFSPLENFILKKSPIMRATQEKSLIFSKIIQEILFNGINICSLPCGLMSDLLDIEYSKIKNFHLYGIDIDEDSIIQAKNKAKSLGLEERTTFIKENAWELKIDNKFDIIVSNGLNIYVDSDEQLTHLFTIFCKMLRPNGTLITSFVTPLPTEKECCWNFNEFEEEDLIKQKIIFQDVLQVKWFATKTYEQMKELFQSSGLFISKIIFDKANIFPTVMVKKIN